MARYIFDVVSAAVAGMAVLPSLHRLRGSVTLGGRTRWHQSERRKGAAYRTVSVNVQGNGVDSAIEPEELPLPFPSINLASTPPGKRSRGNFRAE